MSEEFSYKFPLFVIAKSFGPDSKDPNSISCDGIASWRGKDRRALLIFTDREAAEQYRDDYLPERGVFEVPSRLYLAALLQGARQFVDRIVLDPLTFRMEISEVDIDGVLRSLLDE
jgi:hypothetical protein